MADRAARPENTCQEPALARPLPDLLAGGGDSGRQGNGLAQNLTSILRRTVRLLHRYEPPHDRGNSTTDIKAATLVLRRRAVFGPSGTPNPLRPKTLRSLHNLPVAPSDPAV